MLNKCHLIRSRIRRLSGWLLLAGLFLCFFPACDDPEDPEGENGGGGGISAFQPLRMQFGSAETGGTDWAAVSFYAIYDTLVQDFQMGGLADGRRLLLNLRQPPVLGTFTEADGLGGSLNTESGLHLLDTGFLRVDSIRSDSLFGQFSARFVSTGGEVLFANSGLIRGLPMRFQGTPGGEITGSLTMDVSLFPWEATEQLVATRSGPLLVELTARNPFGRVPGTLRMVMALPVGETGTFAFNQSPGWGGSYVTQNATYFFENDFTVFISRNDSTGLSGTFMGTAGNPQTLTDYITLENGRFEDVPVVFLSE